LIRSTREGKLYSAKFGERMRGTGELADQIRQSFQVFRRKFGFANSLPPLDYSQFGVPRPTKGQLTLF
jgi:hypothetical protein